MVPRCRICAEPLAEPHIATSDLCTLCEIRTTEEQRRLRRPLRAGVIDSA